jgi:hypothetical protein
MCQERITGLTDISQANSATAGITISNQGVSGLRRIRYATNVVQPIRVGGITMIRAA